MLESTKQVNVIAVPVNGRLGVKSVSVFEDGLTERFVDSRGIEVPYLPFDEAGQNEITVFDLGTFHTPYRGEEQARELRPIVIYYVGYKKDVPSKEVLSKIRL